MRPLNLSLALSLAVSANAQWSTDPANPMVVCNAPNDQRHMRAIADADSGYYVFWSDLRNNPNKADLYGQHFDSEGNALWAANGELLLSNPIKSINQVAPLLMPDGSVIVSFITGAAITQGDTMRAMRYDPAGNTLWSEPSVLATDSWIFSGPKAIASDSCAYVVAYCESFGVGGHKMQRVRMDGTVQFPMPGQTTVSSFHGPHTIHPDGADGLLFSVRASNGAGTPLKAQRFDSLGAAVWPTYIDLADADGLNYAFATAMDDASAQTAVWEVNGDVRMNRIDTLGNPLWSPAVLPACDLAVHTQQDPAVLSMGNEVFVAWEDNRPPAANSDLYVQKYNLTTGAELWAADGVAAIQINTFIPTTGLVPSDSGAVITTFDGSMDGYVARRLRNDGTQAWPDPVAMCVPSLNPFYEQRVHLPDGNGGVVAFWQSFAGDLYGARVYRNGLLYDDVAIAEMPRTNAVRIHPNPATERVWFALDRSEPVVSTAAIDAYGRSTALPSTGPGTCDVSDLSVGAYTLCIRTSSLIHYARFIKH